MGDEHDQNILYVGMKFSKNKTVFKKGFEEIACLFIVRHIKDAAICEEESILRVCRHLSLGHCSLQK